jgi:hypothetical protein
MDYLALKGVLPPQFLIVCSISVYCQQRSMPVVIPF